MGTDKFEVKFQKLNQYSAKFSIKGPDRQTLKMGKFRVLDEQEQTKAFDAIEALIGDHVPDIRTLRLEWMTEIDDMMNKEEPNQQPPPTVAQKEISEQELKKTDASILDDAESYLDNPRLIECVGRDLDDMGIVGDNVVKMLLYLCGISRLFVNPFSVLIQGASSSGKSFISKIVVKLFPDESKLDFTSFSEKALFYMGENFLMNRFVVAGERPKDADRDQGNGDGQRGREVLRQLLSEKQVTRAVTSEKSRSVELHTAFGPIAFVETTTTTRIMEEDLNRVIAIETDDSPEQTARVLEQIAIDCSGAPTDENKDRIQKVHHALHRLMISELGTGVSVSVPYVDQIQKMFSIARQPATRRYCNSFLAVIYAITTLYYRQRERDQYGRLVATPDDYVAARLMMDELLASSLLDTATIKEQQLITTLQDTFGEEVFTLKEAADALKLHRGTVGRKLKSLASKGAAEQVLTATGKTAGKYRLLESKTLTFLTDLEVRDEVE